MPYLSRFLNMNYLNMSLKCRFDVAFSVFFYAKM
nr:MAG TPA: hypothetical protein [Caudoviricetes sp.]